MNIKTSVLEPVEVDLLKVIYFCVPYKKSLHTWGVGGHISALGPLSKPKSLDGNKNINPMHHSNSMLELLHECIFNENKKVISFTV